MDTNQTPATDETTPQGQPDTTGPTETEIPDATAIDARIKSGELKEEAEAAFSQEDTTPLVITKAQ